LFSAFLGNEVQYFAATRSGAVSPAYLFSPGASGLFETRVNNLTTAGLERILKEH